MRGDLFTVVPLAGPPRWTVVGPGLRGYAFGEGYRSEAEAEKAAALFLLVYTAAQEEVRRDIRRAMGIE